MQAGGTNHNEARTKQDGAKSKPLIPRSWFEAAGWILLITLLWGTDLLSKISERDVSGIGKDNFRLISEQVTSALAVLIMILFVIQWLKLFPLKRGAWVPAIIGHTAGSVLFAFGHHSLMVAMRIPWYAANGERYLWREPFVSNLIIEYQKDIKIYLGIVVIIAAYQLHMRTRSATRKRQNQRLMVQTGTGHSVLRFDQIDYLEAARNYVAVHAGDREYVVRDTMAEVLQKLSAGPFVRTHRSFIVNMDKIREIRSADSKQHIILHDGRSVPLSRGYREDFNAIFSS